MEDVATFRAIIHLNNNLSMNNVTFNRDIAAFINVSSNLRCFLLIFASYDRFKSQGIETPEMLNPRNQASRPRDWQGIETPEILYPRNQASRPEDWHGIEIPEILNPRNQASRPWDWQGIEIPENLNPRNHASRPWDL
ncbi:uncharacterized protein G2W53_028960 [Senna tora]|uniref:Uncharacterized protein n=1 Tax=Senna tora TaxID=362788 RepID=A0A834T4J2_9FABA|nr:uncharacterized protein G2W53_028960 [Senna tora]